LTYFTVDGDEVVRRCLGCGAESETVILCTPEKEEQG
jgi:hypothetical protein